MPHNPPTRATPYGRFPVRLPIRMTGEERAIIGKAAFLHNRSISRFLVELATLEKPPLRGEERARIRFLHALFSGATDKVKTALASERWANEEGEEIAGARECLQEVLRLLDAIGQELGRRIA